MLVYRIVHKTYIDPFFAPGLSGRWNGAGRNVLYVAESLSLAFMESMIRRQGVGFNHDFKTLIFELPEMVSMDLVYAKDLPDGWRDFRDYTICQKIGNAWFDAGTSLALKVPSAVIITSYNIVLNTLRPDFKMLKLMAQTELIRDERIEDILKKSGR